MEFHDAPTSIPEVVPNEMRRLPLGVFAPEIEWRGIAARLVRHG
jgi:hypothetical protein